MTEGTDFRALFLEECEELISQLSDGLSALQRGEANQLDTVFRAVHSIKGGASAFDMHELVRFAHRFEDLMDTLRKAKAVPEGGVLDKLARGGDVLELLIERARDGDDGELPDWARQAQAWFEGEDPILPPLHEVEGAEAIEPTPAEGKTLTIVIRPRAGFFLSGHDPVKLLRAARRVGLSDHSIEGEVASLDTLDPSICPFHWHLTFVDYSLEDLREFFSVYDLSLEIAGLPGPAPIASGVAEPSLPAPDAAAPRPGRTLRVELDRIDRIVNLVGEIVIAQAALVQVEAEGASDRATTAIDELSRLIREMQDNVMSIRAQPIKTVFSRMPRVVRDLSEILQREVRLEVEGEQTEVDTTVIEELVEPLTHALRNAMDHGIEPPDERLAAGKPRHGTITLTAAHRGEQVIITVTDDGRGIPRDAVLRKALERGLIASGEGLSPEAIDNLVFLPGFSTCQEVSEISGRGVGMDVVKRKITGLGGRCRIASIPGVGMQMSLTLPLTLAVLDGMVVHIADARYVIPLAGVAEAIRFDMRDLHILPDRTVMLSRRGQHLPVHDLAELLGLEGRDRRPDQLGLIVDTESRGAVVVIVDSLIGQRQVVLKSLEANYRHVQGVSGATILGDGQVALILDIAALIAPRRPHIPNTGLEVA